MKRAVPPLEQYAYGALPVGVSAPIQVIRSVETKRSGTKPTKQQLQIHARRRQIKTPELVRTLRDNLGVYRETLPTVGLDILSNLYVLFQNNILKSRILTEFSQSRDNIRLLNSYFYGDENICLLLKYSKQIYLIVLKGTYSELMRHETTNSQSQQRQFLPTPILLHAIGNMLQIAFAVAIQGTNASTQLPVPFQEESPILPLSAHLED